MLGRLGVSSGVHKMRRVLVLVALIGSVLLAAPGASAIGGTRHCDFDDDGYDDLAIGVGGEAIGAEDNAGAVNVIYGSGDRLTSIGDQVWFQDVAGIADASEASDWFGLSVECGDFNDDGYADLVIGVPLEDVGTAASAGAIHLLFGSEAGLTADDSLFLHRDVPGVAGTTESGERFGWSLAAGDFDGDGDDDLAVGAFRDDVNGVVDAGSVHVFDGFAGGLDTSGDRIWHRGRAGIKGPLTMGATFGSSLASGDFDGDGDDDLAIGARGDTINGLDSAGSVSVIYGSPNGLSQRGDDYFHRATPGIRGAPAPADLFGHAVAAGDFDADGDDDLAIGVPFDEVGLVDDAGSVQVLEGGPNGLRKKGDRIWHRNKPGVRHSAGALDHFGYSLTTGRFDSSSTYDLAIGVRDDTVGAIAATGSVHVLYGSGSGLSRSGDQVWHQDRAGIAGTNETGDRYGHSVGAGDFDGNGRHDLAVAIPFDDSDAAMTVDSGKVGVIYGRSGGLAAAGDQAWSQDSAGIGGVAESGDFFGRNVSGATN